MLSVQTVVPDTYAEPLGITDQGYRVGKNYVLITMSSKDLN